MSYNFNQKIDRDFLTSMYDDDYLYIAEIFQTTYNQLGSDVVLLKKYFAQGDVTNLKRQVHKIKPAFGFVGLSGTEAACQQFENKCLSVTSTEAIQSEYEQLAGLLDESVVIIATEIEKLKEYNS
ncbi:MAG: Hpt domain-containing protein [Chitinophagaceae bacterium]|nr:MAG: Hpt domain-containing protein [Chitinophagaceae bacterium]